MPVASNLFFNFAYNSVFCDIGGKTEYLSEYSFIFCFCSIFRIQPSLRFQSFDFQLSTAIYWIAFFSREPKYRHTRAKVNSRSRCVVQLGLMTLLILKKCCFNLTLISERTPKTTYLTMLNSICINLLVCWFCIKIFKIE